MITAIIVVITLMSFIFYLYKNAYKRPDNFPPGPPSLPIYGSYWFVLACDFYDLGKAFLKLGRKYKTKVVGMYFGSFPSFIINDPALIKEMLCHEDCDGRMDHILSRLRAFWKKQGIFFTDGYFWQIQRRFSLRYLRDFGFGRRDESLEAVMTTEIQEMIDMAINGPKYPAEKDLVKDDLIFLPHYFAAPFINGLLHVFSRMTVPRADYHSLWDLARGSLIFQRNSDDLGRALVVTPWLKDIIPNWSGYAGLWNGNQYYINFYTKLINEVMATHDDAHDRHFLDMYIRKMKEEVREKGRTTFSVEQLVMICTDYTFPTASAVEAVLTKLIERVILQPEIQEKIHEEIDRVVGRNRLPNLDDKKIMPYTEACIREAMRYDTLVPLGVGHRAIKDTKLGGYNIPKNTYLAANFFSLNTDKEIWGDPENFRPERFIVDGEISLATDKSLPFGAGKRLCAGETFARQTLFLVFSGFMQAFHVSTANGRPLKKPAKRIHAVIITIPDHWVKVTPRKQ